MRVFNFGSLNIDHVYSMDKFVSPGETLPSISYSKFAGGKGLNQSIALAKAGIKVTHLGSVGEDGYFLRDLLDTNGVDAQELQILSFASGHAIIQVDANGENCIILHGGANVKNDEDKVLQKLQNAENGDIFLTQNETNGVAFLISKAKDLGLTTVFNPAPMTEDVSNYPLEKVDYLILNYTEGKMLSGASESSKIIETLSQKYPRAKIVLTLGADGVIYKDDVEEIKVESIETEVIDSTSAGDTFSAYFIAGINMGLDVKAALRQGCKASSICITREGAANSIPSIDEVLELGESNGSS